MSMKEVLVAVVMSMMNAAAQEFKQLPSIQFIAASVDPTSPGIQVRSD